jgi:S-adenosylmethionine:tRNA ribosyltransferase-isomerase
LRHRTVADLAEECRAGDLVIVNDTRVLPARVQLVRQTGARIEALVLEPAGGSADGGRWEALLRPSRRVRPGDLLATGDGAPAAVAEADLGEGRWRLRWCFGGDDVEHEHDIEHEHDVEHERAGGPPGEQAVVAFLERHGDVPLPPYLTSGIEDPERYQTVYARRPASAAAPTAGLHLTEALLGRLATRGVGLARLELVVGLGTFRPISSERVEDHPMHTEAYRIPTETLEALHALRARRPAGRVLAVGTTVVRALESWAATGCVAGRTDLFIRRGFEFRVVDRLLTNFHVPRSSLLVLVDAFVGPRWRQLYEEALAGGYRFLSLGDAMLLERAAETRR